MGPTLGQDSIDKGSKAGLIGFVLVILTLLVVYKLTGINAVLALLLNIVLVFGFLSMFGATLTLPGIAGIVLTIGMAVDANVLIFERIREELRSGRTVKSAIVAGFGKALSSIVDANATTMIAALFLFMFGTRADPWLRGHALDRYPRVTVHRRLHQPLAVRFQYLAPRSNRQAVDLAATASADVFRGAGDAVSDR